MSFPLIGNRGAAETTARMIETGRFPHALLIEGEDGTGKRTLASYLAAAVLCEGENPPCEKCKSCHLVSVGTHPDLYTVAPEAGKKNIAVEQVRKLIRETAVRPQMARSRVFVVREADTMNLQSQNALLKVLEEPVGHTVFLLLCRSRTSLLPTVISRCVTLSLITPSHEEVLSYLAERFPSKEPRAIEEAAVRCADNLGRILGEWQTEKGKDFFDLSKQYLAAMRNRNGYEMLTLVQPVLRDRVSADRFLAELSYLFLREIRENVDDGYEVRHLTAAYDRLLLAQESLKTNINLSLLFTGLAAEYKELYSA